MTASEPDAGGVERLIMLAFVFRKVPAELLPSEQVLVFLESGIMPIAFIWAVEIPTIAPGSRLADAVGVERLIIRDFVFR